jgi:lipoate-protein ligase A
VASFDNLPDSNTKYLQYIQFARFPGSLNMAIDHLLNERCIEINAPIIRFYGWKPYCISIGYHQKSNLIDFVYLKQMGIDIVRRPTGGRAIFHANELTYSINCPRSIMNHKDLYFYFHQIFADALRSLDYQVDLKTDNDELAGLTHNADDFACFTKSAQTEVQFAGKKLIGSAQKIYTETILQHGSILIGKEHQRLTKFLNVSHSEKLNIKNEIKNKTICLKEIRTGQISQEKIIESIIEQLELLRGISVNSRTLTDAEIDSAREYEKNYTLL